MDHFHAPLLAALGSHSVIIMESTSHVKINEKKDRKMEHFSGSLLEGLGSYSVTILGSKSHIKIYQKINAILDRFLDDFGPFLGSMWGPLRAPGCHRDAPKTLQDALKRLPRCSQDAQGRQ